MSKKVFNRSKSEAFHLHYSVITANYGYHTVAETTVLASFETIVDGYPGPLLGSEELLQWALTEIKIREMPAKTFLCGGSVLK